MSESKYKQSELGEVTQERRIPRGWRLVKLCDVSIAFVSGGTPSTSRLDYWDGDMAWMTSSHLTAREVTTAQRYITRDGLENSATNVVPKDSLLVATRVGVGKVAVNRIDTTISQDLTGIVLDKKRVSTDFLYWFLSSSRHKLRSLAQGSTIRGILRQDLGKLELFLPSLPEQQRIAEILSTVDETIQKIDHAIEKTRRLKTGLMYRLLTRGIGHKEFKETEIGRIPREWQVKELEKVAHINRESRDPARECPDGRFFYVDIDSVENGTGVFRNVREVVGKDAPSRARRVVRRNDVIMSTVRPYLKAFAIVPETYDNQISSTGFAVLTCKQNILPIYLLYTLFSDPFVQQCNKAMVGGQYPALNSSQVARIMVPIPSLLEQQKIAEILSTVDRRLELLTGKKQRLERTKAGLMNDLLTGRRRVKLTH